MGTFSIHYCTHSNTHTHTHTNTHTYMQTQTHPCMREMTFVTHSGNGNEPEAANSLGIVECCLTENHIEAVSFLSINLYHFVLSWNILVRSTYEQQSTQVKVTNHHAAQLFGHNEVKKHKSTIPIPLHTIGQPFTRHNSTHILVPFRL